MRILLLSRTTVLALVVVVLTGCWNKQGNSETVSGGAKLKLGKMTSPTATDGDLIADYPNSAMAKGVKGNPNAYDIAAAASAHKSKSTNSTSIPATSSNPKIIKNATIRIRVKDFHAAGSQIEEIVRQQGAYFSSQTESNSSDSRENHAVIRVGNEKFDSFVKELVMVAERIDSKNTSIDDATGEFVDIQARLKVKKETESRFYEILKQARTVSDILEVQEKINEIREEIDAAEGRLQLLGNQVSFSTVNLEYYERLTQSTVASEDTFGENLVRGFSGGWHGLLSLIIFTVTIWPLWVVGAVILFIIIKSTKRIRRRAKGEIPAKD